MKSLIEIKGVLESFVTEGLTEKAIKSLIQEIELFHGETVNEIRLLSAKFEKVKTEYQEGTITKKEEEVRIQQINKAILSLSNKIDLLVPNEGSTKRTKIESKMTFLRKYAASLKRLLETTNYVNDSIDFHQKEVSNWCSKISFKDVKASKVTDRIYVDLDYYVIPRRAHFEPAERQNLISLRNIWKSCKTHLIILGEPGAGKTTTMKKIVLKNLKKRKLLSKIQGKDISVSTPLVLRLRELNDSSKGSNSIIIAKILSILGIDHDFNREQTENAQEHLYGLYLSIIDDLHLLIVLDGFDELRNDLRKACVKELKRLCLSLSTSRIVLTSRTADFNFSIDNTSEFEISPLNDNQIRKFIDNWIGDVDTAEQLYYKIQDSPYADTAMKPLNLAHICAIYERNLTIPEKPKTIYRKLINLLLEEWDIQRNIKRESQYAKFESDRKLEFLANLAYYLTTTHGSSIFSDSDLRVAYENIHENFGLPADEKSRVVDEIESHTGIFIKSGYDTYEFVHKSTQEYLSAEYLVKLPYIPSKETIIEIPSEVALAVAISSNPTIYLSQLIYNYLIDPEFSNIFLNSFLNRIAIEKPDFFPTEELGISILYLFSINSIRARLNQGGVDLSSILNFEAVQKSIEKVSTIYRVVDNLSNDDYLDVRRFYDVDRVMYHFSPSINKSEYGISVIKAKSQFKLSNNQVAPNVLLFDSSLY